MIIRTHRGSAFDTTKPVLSNLLMVLDGKGRQVMDDKATLTGKCAHIEDVTGEFTELEVSHSYGTDFISEDYLWQH